MITGGVDLAADPKRTALCTIDWSTGEVELSDAPVGDDAIVALAHRAALSGWDVPLGWPDAFVAALGEHHPGPAAGEGVTEAGPDARRLMRYRLTDRRFAGHSPNGRWPLSVSTDLIGVPALRAAALQRRVCDEGLIVDRSGTAGVVAETYPAGTLAAWALPSRGYKGAAGRDVRAGLVDRLAEALPRLEWTEALRASMVASDDRLDALVCALVARSVATGRGTPPPSADVAVARREGWIHVPQVGPSDLHDG
ncbi:MAG: DUF429 domain-containing protein [Microthrixaceae bacterium]|nr:DUF429 domain-containing protein [Microthrixaceae bacterium]